MKKYFITSTGTDIGKTFITAALTKILRKQGKSVIALKPVISGFDPADMDKSDTGILLKAQDLPITEAHIHSLSPWRFREPISPDMAAENEERNIEFDKLTAFCREQKEVDHLLIEGAGGVMTPIDKTHTVLDWMTALDYEILLISGSYLGALSHALTSYQAIIARKLKLHSIIINESEISPVTPERILLTLKRFLPNNLPLYYVTRLDHTENLKKIRL